MSATLSAPSDWVRRWAHLIVPGGQVLDLACGLGRHARFLAELGHAVLACDRDPEVLAPLAGVPGVNVLQADLEGAGWPFGDRRFDAIVVTNYLHRPLLPILPTALAPGGALIYETFLSGNARFGKPSNPQFLLGRDELLKAFDEALLIVAFEQGSTCRPKAAFVQRLCAVNRDDLDNALEPVATPGIA